MAGNKRKLRETPEKSKKSKACTEESTPVVALEQPIKTEDFEEQPMETTHDTSDVIEVSEDSGTQDDDDSDWNPNMSQFFDAQLLVEEDEAFSDDGESDHEEVESDADKMTDDVLQNQTEPTDDPTITHEGTVYTLVKMTRYYCTVCNTSYSLQSNCLRHVDTMHPELSTSYEYVEDKITKVYQCGTCRKILPSLQSVHKHSSACGKPPPRSPSPEIQDDSEYDPQEEDEEEEEEDDDDDDDGDEEDIENAIKNKTFEDDLVYDDSKYDVTETERFQCNICKNSFKNHNSCITHLKHTHSKNKDQWDYIDAKNIKVYICKTCNREYLSLKPVAKHVFLCGVLKQKNERDLKTMHKCQVCLNYFPSIEHECKGNTCEVNKTHAMVMKKMIQCPVCERLFPKADKYMNHFNSKHAEEGLCPTVELKQHTFGKCHICTSWSVHATKELLVEHMLRHGILSFDINTEVVQELQIVAPKPKSNNQKPREGLTNGTAVQGCDENISTQQSGTKQAYSVGMSKVATCPLCDKVFSHAFKCKNHIQKTHPQQNEEEARINVTSILRKVYICHKCPGKTGKLFQCVSLLALHLLKHKFILSDENIAAELIPIKTDNDVTTEGSKTGDKHTKKTPNKKNNQKNTKTSPKVCNTEEKHDEKHENIETRKVTMCPVCKKLFSQASVCKNHIKKQHPHEDVELLCSNVTKILRPLYVCHVCPGKVGKMYHCISLLAQHLLHHCITLTDADIIARLIPIKTDNDNTLESADENSDSNAAKKTKISSNKKKNEEHVIKDHGTHTTEKKIVVSCPVCSMVFSHVFKCKIHIKTKHSEENLESLCSGLTKTLQTISICHVCTNKEQKMFHDMKILAQHMLKHKITLSDNGITSPTKSIKNTKSKKHQTNTSNEKVAPKSPTKTGSDQMKQSSSAAIDPEIEPEKINKKKNLNSKIKIKQSKKNNNEKSNAKVEIKGRKSYKKDNLNTKKKSETCKIQEPDKKPKVKTNILKDTMLKLKNKSPGKKNVAGHESKSKKKLSAKLALSKKPESVPNEVKDEPKLSLKRVSSKKPVVVMQKLDVSPSKINTINVKNFKHK